MGDLTAQQARDQLGRADAPPLTADRDRRVHGWATVVLMLAAITVLNVPSLAPSPWLLSGLGVLVALPMLVAGSQIRRRPRR